MRKTVRIWSAAAAVAAVAAGSIGTAVAVTSPPSPRPKPAVTTPAAPTAEVSAAGVRAWQPFRIRGTLPGVPAGTRVTLQQQVGARPWVNLPASMQTDAHATYTMRVVLGMKGHNKLRLVDSRMRVVSPLIDVWVR
ncbi:hypothetical protein [Streptomyces sp. NBC_00557]|uniref:hypothetical protein n=1 Tax=Streptomyces sp. NBC_00557 TaxID=2975776 RepID=UPI002E817671|nr:hypothetical protein [Streptomyces sp. NBC_00557]WUC39088.1 hypothetical protein OG956_35095 [Streptomyces sp. NBC_00557]